MKIIPYGAAKVVSGSCYHIQVENTTFMIDCGMFQGKPDLVRHNYDPFGFNPRDIEFLILTHAHIDHSGLLPKLYNHGFRGKIFATPPTIDFVDILLQDSARIQLESVENENKRRERKGLPLREPLYTADEALETMKLFVPVEYNTMLTINENITVRYQDAGHILGSASIEVFVTEGGTQKKIVFSGDIGQWNTPIVQDPTLIEKADYVFIESTYGDRLHENVELREDTLAKVVQQTFDKGGRLLIPSFAVERTQELLYYFNRMANAGKFPRQKIFLDSPLAIKATELFKKYVRYYDDDARKTYQTFLSPEYLECLSKNTDSQRLNNYTDPCIVIAGNGMCSGGRIMHHLKHGLWKKENTLLFVGFQAEGTLGREILDGEKEVKIFGQDVIVQAQVEKITGFSGHSDANGLIKRAQGFHPAPQKMFITHGEGTGQTGLQERLGTIGIEAYIPSLGEVIEL